jgi:hypothetical protein
MSRRIYKKFHIDINYKTEIKIERLNCMNAAEKSFMTFLHTLILIQTHCAVILCHWIGKYSQSLSLKLDHMLF